MNKLIDLKNILNRGNNERTTVRNLYFVMQKVGGYENLMNMAYISVVETLKCMEWEAKELNRIRRKK